MMFFNYSMIMIFSLATVVVAIVTLLSSTMVAVFTFSIFSLFSAILYLILQAPDVAITEAAVGSAISAIFFIMAIRAIENNIGSKKLYYSKEHKIRITAEKMMISKSFHLFIIVVVFIFVGIASSFIEITNLSNNKFPASEYYIQNSYRETGVNNIITSILASYRGFDTLIENLVILTAAIGVFVILRTKDEDLNQLNSVNGQNAKNKLEK